MGLFLAVVGVYAQTCTVDDSDSDQGMFEKLSPKRCLPGEPGSAGKDTGTRIDADQTETPTQNGLSRESLQHMQILSKSPIFLDGPSAILGQQDLLQLTSQQKEQLMDLLGEMRIRANKILTPRQRARLTDLPDQPLSIDQVCNQMRIQMSRNKNGATNNNSEFKCPICPAWQNNTKAPSTQPAQDQ